MESATPPVPEQPQSAAKPKPAKYAEAKKPAKHGLIVRGISWCIALPVIVCCLAGVLAALAVCCVVALVGFVALLAITIPLAAIRWIFMSILSATEIAIFGKHKHVCPFNPIYQFAFVLKGVLEMMACCP